MKLNFALFALATSIFSSSFAANTNESKIQKPTYLSNSNVEADLNSFKIPNTGIANQTYLIDIKNLNFSDFVIANLLDTVLAQRQTEIDLVADLEFVASVNTDPNVLKKISKRLKIIKEAQLNNCNAYGSIFFYYKAIPENTKLRAQTEILSTEVSNHCNLLARSLK
ncbi:MAG: hypothetical protein Q7K26_06430 [bacterium]|nr:hypothetical protein [bacterium]